MTTGPAISPNLRKFPKKASTRASGAERAPEGSTRSSSRLRHVRGAPPARAQPSRSHLGTARRSQCRHPAPSLPARPEHAADTCARDSRAAAMAIGEVDRGGLRRGDLARDARRRAEAVGGPAARVRGPAGPETQPLAAAAGQDGAEMARVRALARAAHLRRRPGCGPTSTRRAEAGGAPAPDATTALSRSQGVEAAEGRCHRGRQMTVTRAGRRHDGRGRRAPLCHHRVG